MSRAIKQKADELVKLFKPISSGLTCVDNKKIGYSDEVRLKKATLTATLHQKILIEKIEWIWLATLNKPKLLWDRLEEQEAILTELKSRL